MKERIRKMPRPVPRNRFSGASGSGRVSGSRPLPWSATLMTSDLPVFSRLTAICLDGIVFVAVQNRVYSGFAHGHSEVETLIFVQTGLFSQFVRGSLHRTDALHGRTQRETHPSFLRCVHRACFHLCMSARAGRILSRVSNLARSFVAKSNCVKREGPGDVAASSSLHTMMGPTQGGPRCD